jgi:hypothetical protein
MTTPNLDRLCKDCAHLKVDKHLPKSQYWECKTSYTQVRSPVDGEYYSTPPGLGMVATFCSVKRNDPTDPCGPEGKLWQPADRA